MTPESLGGLPVISVDRRDGVRFDLEGGAWVAARLSGTEPLARIYSEAASESVIDVCMADLRRILQI